MTLKRYRIMETIMLIVLGVSVGVATAQGYVWMPAPFIIAFVIIGVLMRRRVKEFAVDERVNNIAEKSLALASGAFIIVAAPVGLTLVAMGNEASPELETIGWTLAAASCGQVLIYSIAYIYYNSKYSGKK